MIKKVGMNLYVHRSNVKELLNLLNKKNSDFSVYVHTLIKRSNTNKVIEYTQGYIESCIYESKFPYFDVLKVNLIDRSVSFILSVDWNSVNEPTVGDSVKYIDAMPITIRKGGKQVYHSKWMFVDSNYKGFDVRQAKKRTQQWESIEGIKEVKKYIGYKDYWYTWLKEHNIAR